jgi:hypothetical protein
MVKQRRRPTNHELRQFLALDNERTQGEWLDNRGVLLAPMPDDPLRTCDPATVKWPPDGRYIAACTRIARPAVIELLERRGKDVADELTH